MINLDNINELAAAMSKAQGQMKQDYSLIPERIMQNLLYYVKGEQVPGGFLYAVLCNDLFGAIGKADDEMLPLIPLLVLYIYNEVPTSCHGSIEHVNAWMNKNI